MLETNSATLISTLALISVPLIVAVMLAVPRATPVTTPSTTVATAVLSLAHSTSKVAGSSVGVIVALPPTAIVFALAAKVIVGSLS